jgi:Tfp pilus assembly protein PilE
MIAIKSPNRRSAMKKKFTLIELLMVICIIMILLSLLFPAFQQGRKMAHLAVCTSNMKQVHQLKYLYLSNNKQTFYEGENSVLNWFGINGSRNFYQTGANKIGTRPLNKYLGLELNGSTQVKSYQCPASQQGYYRNEGADYVANIMWSYGTPRPAKKVLGKEFCRTIDKVVSPSTTSMIEEDVAFDISVGIITGTKAYGETVFWHTAPGDYRWNMVFVDGSRQTLMPIGLGIHTVSEPGLRYTYDATLAQ